MIFCGWRVKMSIYQSLRYYVAFEINGMSNGYILITMHDLNHGFSLPLSNTSYLIPSPHKMPLNNMLLFC